MSCGCGVFLWCTLMLVSFTSQFVGIMEEDDPVMMDSLNFIPDQHWYSMDLDIDERVIDKAKKFCNQVFPGKNENVKKKLIGYPEAVFESHDTESGEAVYGDMLRQQVLDFDKKFEKKPDWFNRMKEKLETYINKVVAGKNRMEIKHWAILHSFPGCEKQEDHSDVPDPEFPCVAGILSLDDSTSLYISKEDARKRSVMKKKRIYKGHAIIWRADFVHAGSEYSEANSRIYFKAAPVGVSFTKTQNESVSVFEYRCVCKASFEKQRQLKDHKKICKKLNGPQKVQATKLRKRINNQNYYEKNKKNTKKGGK